MCDRSSPWAPVKVQTHERGESEQIGEETVKALEAPLEEVLQHEQPEWQRCRA